MSHGKTLRLYLIEHKISVDSFIDRVGVSRQSVYNWLNKNEFSEAIMNTVVKKGKIPKSIFTYADSLEVRLQKAEDRIDVLFKMIANIKK